ncbi:LUD domain-containing protein, partial [Helicobacter pylori]
AKDGDEANEIIYNLAKEKNIKHILKQKSMASEEIGLNHYLKEKGIQAQETDLGELIIQLINEHPVHIVVPAIHKNRKQIGKIFEEKLN